MSKEIKKAELTAQQMIDNGWVKTKDEVFIYEKVVPNRNPLNASEDSDIKLVVHGMYNEWTFAIQLPDGGLLNFVANSLKDLKNFERMINFYDPPF